MGCGCGGSTPKLIVNGRLVERKGNMPNVAPSTPSLAKRDDSKRTIARQQV